MTSGMMAVDPSIPREDPDLDADELTVLGQYLDYHRATLAMKCARLSDADLKRRAIPTSGLTLLGLVRHLTEVEYGWFCEWLDGPAGDVGSTSPTTTPTATSTTWTPHPSPMSGRPTRPRSRSRAGSSDVHRRRGAGSWAARAVQPAAQRPLDRRPHDRGVRPAQRPRRPAPGGHRRRDRRVAARWPPGEDPDDRRVHPLHRRHPDAPAPSGRPTSRRRRSCRRTRAAWRTRSARASTEPTPLRGPDRVGLARGAPGGLPRGPGVRRLLRAGPAVRRRHRGDAPLRGAPPRPTCPRRDGRPSTSGPAGSAIAGLTRRLLRPGRGRRAARHRSSPAG